MRRPIVAALGLAAFGVAAVACSLLVPLNDVQCSTDGDCAARGAGFAGAVCVSNVCVRSSEAAVDAPSEAATVDAGGPWGCLQLAPDPSGTGTTDVQILVFDAFQTYTLGGSIDGGTDLQFVEGTVVPGVSVQVCQPLDPKCAGTTPAVTNDAGLVDFPSVNGAFEGYYLLQQVGVAFPELFYTGRLLASEPTTFFPTSLLPYNLAAALGGTIGVDVNTDQDGGPGHIFMQAFDCTDHHTAGVSYTLNVEAGTQFYQQGGLPTTTATQTDPAGVGGFLNVPAGIVKVTATVVTENNLALPAYSVFVRSGGQTLVYFRPKSRPTQ